MEVIFQAPGTYHAPGSVAEKLLTIREAADIVGAHYWQLQRAVKRGDIPSYRPFNSRKLVKLSEVVAYINSCRQGGAK
jgi:excisionase family DNA binding protein